MSSQKDKMIKKLNKNKLTIKIMDEEDEEKILQETHFKNISNKATSLIENFNLEELNKMHLDEKELSGYNPNINLILDYMEGKNKELDVSYIWLTNLSSLLKLSKCIYFSPKSWEHFYETRDFEEEFKVIFF